VNRREFIGTLAVSTPAVAAAADEQRPAGESATSEPRPLTVTILGTGTPAPSLERQSSGCLIEIGPDLIV
jgi:hypothetical protein